MKKRKFGKAEMDWHWQNAVSLDFDYLRQLGPEAIPALLEYGWLKAPRSVEAAVTADLLAGDPRHALRNPRAWIWRRACLLRTEAEVRTCGSN